MIDESSTTSLTIKILLLLWLRGVSKKFESKSKTAATYFCVFRFWQGQSERMLRKMLWRRSNVSNFCLHIKLLFGVDTQWHGCEWFLCDFGFVVEHLIGVGVVHELEIFKHFRMLVRLLSSPVYFTKKIWAQIVALQQSNGVNTPNKSISHR